MKSQVKGSKTAKKNLRSNDGTEAKKSFLLTAVAGGFAMTLVRNETQRHSAAKVQVKALSAYSHSFTLACCGAIPVNSSWVVGLGRHAAESLRVSSRRRLGQTLGQIRKLFRNREPAVSFLPRGQKRVGFEALKRPI